MAAKKSASPRVGSKTQAKRPPSSPGTAGTKPAASKSVSKPPTPRSRPAEPVDPAAQWHESVMHDPSLPQVTEAMAAPDLTDGIFEEFRSQARRVYSGEALPHRGGMAMAAETANTQPVDAWYGSHGTRLSRVVASRRDPAGGAEMIAEVIIGNDDRQRIHDTTKYPFGCICSLSIVSRNGTRFVGTGWLADPQTVITAGHCLYLHHEGGWAAEIEVFPGRNGPDKPFTAKAAKLWSTRGWTERASGPEDYGAIRLDHPIPAVGHFGYAAETDEFLKAHICNVVGYPADKDGQLWGHARRLSSVRHDTLTYDIDTYGGNSGGPLIVLRENDPVVVGIHNYGDYSGNIATRITPIVYQNVLGWIAAT